MRYIDIAYVQFQTLLQYLIQIFFTYGIYFQYFKCSWYYLLILGIVLNTHLFQILFAASI